MEQHDIMQQLWDYIDGTCDDAARAYTAQMIAAHPEWKNLYDELVALDRSIHSGMETEQPSMRFTKNVMDTIVNTSVAPPIRTYINPLIIRAISAFFILSLLALMTYAFATTEWSNTTSLSSAAGYDRMFNSTVFHVLSWLNIILLLLLLDTFLRRKITIMKQNA